jgi:glycosyltransferase involved in cell wall biosynthesis
LTQSNEHKLNVAAFTGRLDDPASYFRIRQYIPKLRAGGIEVRDFCHNCYGGCWHSGALKVVPYLGAIFKHRKCDVVWLCRTMVRGTETFELLLKRPRVMDADDAIWCECASKKPLLKYSMPHLARRMDAVIAGNTYIAEWFQKYCRSVFIVPTAIDIARYQVVREHQRRDRFIIGWTGTSSNFPYLTWIEKPLWQFLEAHADASLKIIADCPWQSSLIPPERVIFEKWSRAIEVDALHEMAVGIMPLEDTPWTRGKCSFKMLQYMAVGLPVVVSSVGMNLDVLAKGQSGIAVDTRDKWYDALETVYKDEKLRMQFGQCGRQVVEKYYNLENTAAQLADILRTVSGN